MSNQPEDHELFELPLDKKKVEYQEDKKIPNAGKICRFRKFRHIFRRPYIRKSFKKVKFQSSQLLKDQQVIFAGYRRPHPLVNKIELKIQTKPQTKPSVVLHKAIENLTMNVTSLARSFDYALQAYLKK